MKLVSFLSHDRESGLFFVLDGADGIIYGPVRCRGEADNAAAASHDNIQEDPTRPFGDHPSGLYRIELVVDVPEGDQGTYGPHFLKLEPLEGEALRAGERGRTGIGIHGGRPGPKGTSNELRATHGCLRTSNRVITDVTEAVRAHLAAGRNVLYDCRLIDEEA